MSTSRRQRQRDATREEIKQVARQLMHNQGTAALSLHAIAHAMDLTSPALYRYFATRDDLVTALILDAYQAQLDALIAASETVSLTDPCGRLLATILAYREWALEHPVDYALLAGNPVPGYVPPHAIIGEAARRGMDFLMNLVQSTLQQSTAIPAEIILSPALTAMLESLCQERGYAMPLSIVYLVLVGWGEAQGLVLQEVFHQIQPLISDPGELYRHQARSWVRQLGLSVPLA
jgi:AcrR family transcriptional regulator